jgi:hypothetical protein
MTLSYLTRRTLRRDHFFPPVTVRANKESIAYNIVISRPHHLFDYLTCTFSYPIYLVTSVNFGRS